MFKNLNILKLFFEKPTTEYNVREISRIVRVSPATASAKLKELEKEKILKSRNERNLLLFCADLDSTIYRDYKVFYNILKIKKTLLAELNEFYLKPSIIFYGSCSTGLDIENSDLDLVIISENEKKYPELNKLEKKFGKNIQLSVFSEVNKIKNEYLLNNVLNGIIIQGKIEWISKNVLKKD